MSIHDRQLQRHEAITLLDRPTDYYHISRIRRLMRLLLGGQQTETQVVERILLRWKQDDTNQHPNRLLDLGCGPGKTMLSQVEYFSLLVGTDFSPTFCNIAKQQIDSHSLKSKLVVVRNDVLDSLPFGTDCFDVVTMTAVLEHIEDVYQVMSEVHRVLRTDGLIVLSVPNVAVINRRLSFMTGRLPTTCTPRWRWPAEGWDGDHVNYFTLESLRMLFKQTGFRYLGCKGSGYAANIRTRWPSLLSADLICYAVKTRDAE